MPKLKLTMATWDYDRVRPIMDGRVQVEGCEINHVSLAPEECFSRAWANQEFDISELGLGSYVMKVSEGASPYTAIPVFTSRMFRHSAIYVRTDRGIHSPGDLKGKTLTVGAYQAAANVWARGMLQDEYGVTPADIQWIEATPQNSFETGRPTRQEQRLHLPQDFPLQFKNATCDALLNEGAVDGFMGPRTPQAYRDGSGKLTRLFENFETKEKAYYKKTGIFPIMHVVGIRNDVYREHRWLATSLYKAFEESKRIAQADLFETAALKIMLPWQLSAARESREILGSDYWPYGVADNQATLGAALRYTFDQGLQARKLSVEDLFPG